MNIENNIVGNNDSCSSQNRINYQRDLTKIVCFCAFKESSVLEYLQNEDSYLLKLCRESDMLEQTIDAIQPDIILIDCSGNISDASKSDAISEQSNTILPENVEQHIECRANPIESNKPIEEFAESIELVEPIELIEPIKRDEQIIVTTNDGLEYVNLSNNAHPVIMKSYLPEHLPVWNIALKNQILFIFDSDPGLEVKRQCLENRCDFMVAPFPFEELDFRISLHANRKELNYRVSWYKNNLNRAIEHIDKLKAIILGNRKEWRREKELLHNSLIQINMMSNDRDIIKKELRTSRRKLSDNISGINDFLCTMVESRNEYQKGHSKRVADIAAFVADKIGIEAKSIKILKNAAMLHEVGMLLIPSSILNKDSSQWSDYEKKMMLLNPSKGAEYLEKCPGFEKTAKVIRYLNENSDGTGSPEGLKKRYIPVLSKILAGADVLDQIWIDNPHASLERLLEILETYAGSRLDPSIVNYLEKYAVTVLNFQLNHLNLDDNQASYKGRLKEIAVYQLKSGMVLGAGLFTKTGTKLFSAGTKMTQEYMQSLEKYCKEYPIDETVFIRIEK